MSAGGEDLLLPSGKMHADEVHTDAPSSGGYSPASCRSGRTSQSSGSRRVVGGQAYFEWGGELPMLAESDDEEAFASYEAYE